LVEPEEPLEPEVPEEPEEPLEPEGAVGAGFAGAPASTGSVGVTSVESVFVLLEHAATSARPPRATSDSFMELNIEQSSGRIAGVFRASR
jgi:hypothetical protein